MNETAATRPASLEAMMALRARMTTPEQMKKGLEYGLAFVPRPTDVIIAPYGKCGTTWLQQIFHGLRTRGDMDFDDISRVVPWIETAYDLGLDLEAPQRGTPRGYKSHLAYDLVPKGARYIVSIRNPKDALVSAYRFMEGWWFEPGSIPIETFAREAFMRRGARRDYWHHLASWWPHRNDDNVLLLCYEQMSRDVTTTIRRVAAFAGIALDDALLDIVRRQSSIEFMLAHKDRFDDRLMRERSERVGGLPPGSDSAKVRKGKVGEHTTELSPEISAEMDQVWTEDIESKFGFANYVAMAGALARE
ncbi:MAG TPA: sulfotransferase domain-containing protein [Pseudomonadales bacterium]